MDALPLLVLLFHSLLLVTFSRFLSKMTTGKVPPSSTRLTSVEVDEGAAEGSGSEDEFFTPAETPYDDSPEETEESESEYEEEPCPILELPDELIVHILRFLPTGDRWNARVCRRISNIEESSLFYERSVVIDSWNDTYDECDPVINFERGAWGTDAALRKMMRNMHIENLMLEVDDDWKKVPVIKAISAATLDVASWDFDNDYTSEQTTDSTLESWVGGGRMSFRLAGAAGFSGECLFQLLQEMREGRTSLQQFQLQSTGPTPEATRKLLSLIGLSYGPTGFRSSNKDLELYQRTDSMDMDEDEWDKFSTGSACHLFILMGWTMMVTIRKWLANGTVVPALRANQFGYSNEVSIEVFDENGAAPPYEPSFMATLSDIRTNRRFTKVPLSYLE